MIIPSDLVEQVLGFIDTDIQKTETHFRKAISSKERLDICVSSSLKADESPKKEYSNTRLHELDMNTCDTYNELNRLKLNVDNTHTPEMNWLTPYRIFVAGHFNPSITETV
uniref:Uncharacterized protein n=1 Tax=Timema monikensis TaxID=170555 RepID=A0A7R9EIC4_9NEOP|nr:unnamed protein product [Timema monikensis]